MALRLANNVRQAAGDAIVDLIDAGAGAGTIQIRTGAQPTNVADAAQGTLLGTLTFSDPAFGATNSSGVATASAITSDTSADNSGEVGHARILDSNGTIVADCTCAQGSGDINFDEGTVVAGGTIAISAMTVTIPIS